jgi:hypothetical protein
LLVPAQRRVASAAVRHFSGARTRAARIGGSALALALSAGLDGPVLGTVRIDVPQGADTIEAHLREAVSPGIWVSVYLGPARANRKPVLQLLTGDGRTAGFAKIGTSPLARDLVRAEHAALTRLGGAPLRETQVPRVLHYGEWHGLNVLALGPLPMWLRHHRISRARLASAMREVAGVGGLRREPLASGAYLRQLTARLAAADEGPDRAAVRTALDALSAEMGGARLTYGSWHGDWSPWNMASTRRGLLVWDWERFTWGVPLGFDALHCWLHGEVGPRHRDPRRAARECLERSGQLLGPFGVTAPEARLTAALYLAELATRYLADRQAKAGASLGAPGAWLIPALAGEVARMEPGRGRRRSAHA